MPRSSQGSSARLQRSRRAPGGRSPPLGLPRLILWTKIHSQMGVAPNSRARVMQGLALVPFRGSFGYMLF